MKANPLGRIKLHDRRSRDFVDRRLSRRTPVAGISVRHAMNAPNVDQFYTSGCVGFSGTNMLNCAVAVSSRRKMNDWMKQALHNRYLDNNAGLENYHQATVYDPFEGTYPPTDEGSSAIGLMKFWKKYGIITGYNWCLTFDSFLATLQHQPVLLGTEWYEGMMQPNSKGLIKPTGKSVGGHEYLADAILWNNRLIGFDNSWGENWGLGGRFYMTFDAIEALLADGGDVAVPQFL